MGMLHNLHGRGQDGVLYGWEYIRKRAGRLFELMPLYLRSNMCFCARAWGLQWCGPV